jgi:Ca2+-binding RTX toxin-like protein
LIEGHVLNDSDSLAAIKVGAGIANTIAVGEAGSVFGDYAAIGMAGAQDSSLNIHNKGDIDGFYGVFSRGSGSLFVVNDGTLGGQVAAISSISDDNDVINNGTINGSMDFTSLGCTLRNSGTINGAISISTPESSNTTISNTGSLNGYVSLGAGNDYFSNSGTVTDSIGLHAGNDYVKLFGNSLIAGDVSLGEGNDKLVVAGGSISGDVTGNSGDDYYVIRQPGVSLIEFQSDGSDTVETGFTWHLGDNFENLFLTGNDNVNGYGNSLDNAIVGSRGSNQLFGYGGTDTIIGGAGADRLDGGADFDTVVYQNYAATEGVYVDLAKGLGSGGDAAGDRLVAIENITGSLLDDTLRGNIGDNILAGSNGNDVLDGRGGYDLLKGGDGSDAFIFSKGYGHDAIQDFVASGETHDAVNLSGFADMDSFKELKGHMKAAGEDVVITMSKGDTLTIMNVDLKDLHATDFLF